MREETTVNHPQPTTTEERDEDTGADLASILLHPFVKCISVLNFGYAVHPTEPIHLPNSEFISVQEGYRIRILHLKPDELNSELRDLVDFKGENVENVKQIERNSSVRKSVEKRNSVRNSLTEEYWFTRWNKPLQAGSRCSCSFRRSQRYSKVTEELPQVPGSCENAKKETKVQNNVLNSAPTQIKNLETFVERILQETLIEAYQELYIKKITGTNNKPPQNEEKQKINDPPKENTKIKKEKKKAYDNLGYVNSPGDDEVDAVVKRRHKERRKSSKSTSNSQNSANSNQSKNSNCRHNQTKNKPFIFLLHGLGASADIWWNIIASLLPKGYEMAAPDMLGHGYSSAPNKRAAYKFKKLLEHALAAFDFYALRDESRKFIVIGHSFGCSLATAIARYRSTQVVQLVLISGGGPTALSPPEIGNEISVFSNLQVLISPLLFCGMKRSLFYATRGKHFQRCDETDESIPKYVLDYIDREQNWPEGDAAFHRRILIPTLLVHGLKDTKVTLVQECEMERTIPRAFLELIPTAGHMSMLETPEQLSHMILCFLEWWSR